ncbi:MAG: glycosyltransferase family 4 protein [Pseudomonadota bacterium]
MSPAPQNRATAGKSTRDVIVIAGGFALPDRNASAIRALGLARLFSEMGHKTLILGKFEQDPSAGTATPHDVFEGIEMRDIRKPYPDSPRVDYTTRPKGLIHAVERFGEGQRTCLFIYNFPSVVTLRLCAARNRHGFRLALDNTEWRVWEGKRVLRNLMWLLDSRIRTYVTTRLCRNALYTSRFFAAKAPTRNKLVLPFVVDPASRFWSTPGSDADAAPSTPRRFVYSGSPGQGFFKDCIPTTLQAFAALKDEGHAFQLDIVGLTDAQCRSQAPVLAPVLDTLGDMVRFHGRVPHATSVDLVRRADYSVFIRQPTHNANAGFATKFVEAVTLGVPIISNPTSDIPLYLETDRNGVLAASHSVADVTAALRHALMLDDAAYAHMRRQQNSHNPFELDHWTRPMAEFLAKLD